MGVTAVVYVGFPYSRQAVALSYVQFVYNK